MILKSIKGMYVEEVLNEAIILGVLVEDPMMPDELFLNEELSEFISSIGDDKWDFIEKHAKSYDDAVIGLGVISYINWRKEGTDYELQVASYAFHRFYEASKNKDMKEFLAKLRLGERAEMKK